LSDLGLLTTRLTGYSDAVQTLDLVAVDEALSRLADVHARDAAVFICGNGGSASAASHFATDLVKATMAPGLRPLRASALGDNPALLTALANDLAYDRVFAEPLRAYARPGDLLVIISASGNSPNIVAAMEEAPTLGVATVALTGFSGGAARRLADIAIHVPVDDYGIVESVHAVATHLLAFTLRDVLVGAAATTAG